MRRGPVKTVALLLVLPLVTGFLAACAGPEAAKHTPIEITDQLGRVVTLEKTPERIVSLAPSNTEILFALGLGEKVVGVTNYDNFPPEVKEKERVGGFSTPDMEKVVALSPDLIVAASIHQKEVIPELERRGLPVLALDPRTLDDVIEAISIVGSVTGQEKAAERLVKDMRGRIEAVTKQTSALPPQNRPRVLFIVWHDPLMTVGQDTFIDELIEKAGGENIFHDLSSYPTVDLELVLERDPQVIIANTAMGDGPSPFRWANTEPRLGGTEALKGGRVYEIDADLVNRAGPRIVDGLEQMLRIIHPELGATQ